MGRASEHWNQGLARPILKEILSKIGFLPDASVLKQRYTYKHSKHVRCES